MHLYGGNGKHSKHKSEKNTRPRENDYNYDYDYDYEDDYEPEPQPRRSQSREQTRRSEPRHTSETRRGSENKRNTQRRSRRDREEDIRSTNHTVYSGNGYDYEDDIHFASDAYISREEQRRTKHARARADNGLRAAHTLRWRLCGLQDVGKAGRHPERGPEHL